jgi:hypothetical protein
MGREIMTGGVDWLLSDDIDFRWVVNGWFTVGFVWVLVCDDGGLRIMVFFFFFFTGGTLKCGWFCLVV